MIPLLLFLVLAIPVAIHIFSRSEGKVLLFPSIALLPKQSAPTEIQVKLHQKRLLLVRLLLFFLVTLILLFPLIFDYFKFAEDKLTNSASPRQEIIVMQDWWELSTTEQKQGLLASLEEDGFAKASTIILVAHSPSATDSNQMIRSISSKEFLNNGASYSWFATQADAKQENTQASELVGASLQSKELKRQSLHTLNTWSIAQALASSFGPNAAIHIYSSNRLSQFVGDYVNVVSKEQAVFWHILEAPDHSQNHDDAEKTQDALDTLQNNGPIRLAYVKHDNEEHSASQLTMIAAAIEALRLIVPIEFSVLEQGDFDAKSAEAEFDKILLDSVNEAQLYQYSGNAINLSKLTDPQEISFVMELGQAILRDAELMNSLQNTVLSRPQIASKDGFDSFDNAQQKRPRLDALQSEETNPWRQWLILLAVLIFFIERLYSEWSYRLVSNLPERG